MLHQLKNSKMSRTFRLTPCTQKFLAGEGQPMPPLDSGWVDRQYTQWTAPSYPENLPMPDPGHIPSAEYFGDVESQEVLLCIVVVLLLIIILLLLMLISRYR